MAESRFNDDDLPTGSTPRRRCAGPPPGGRERGADELDTGSAAEQHLAHMLKTVYEQERSRWESVRAGMPICYQAPARYSGLPATETTDGVPLTPRTRNEWLHLARIFIKEHYDPEFYVRVQLERVDHHRRIPEPTQLLSGDSIAHYRQARECKGREIALSLVVQRQTAWRDIAFLQLYGGHNAENAHIEVLCSRHVQLSPLFRYCVCRMIKGKRFLVLAAEWRDRAVLQFERYREYYLEAWRDFLPVGFAKMAAARYNAIFFD